MKKKRVLLTKPMRHFPGAEEALEKEVEVIRSPGPSQDEILQLVGPVHGIVASSTVITEKVIQEAPLLQIIAVPQAGFDKIDVAAATRAGVPVVANTGLAPEPVAEFTLGLIIALSRGIVRADRDLRKMKGWAARPPYADPNKLMGVDVHPCVIGIVGLGHIGSTVARMCQNAFSSRVLAYDPYVSKEEMQNLGAEKADSLVNLASEVNFLLLHLELTKATHHLINSEVLRAMRSNAFLINCARGPVVDEAVLIQALKEGWIAGAALDVFEKEPVTSDNPLLEMDNVILTPHIAGVTVESAKKRGFETVRRVLNIFAGERPDGLVNPEVWDHYIKRSNNFPESDT
jgi:D-3-phosphoglycerate dehydrogenase